MELKTIFQMTKTDRYTQDGRDELAKLQETEDVKYKTGDISQKTGLQKQPDGSWASPKGGSKKSAAGKKDAAKPTTEELSTFKDIVREYKKNPNKQTEQIMNEAKSHLMKNRGMTPEQLGKIGREVMAETSKPKAKFDEYGLPDNETISMKEEFLKKEKVADPNKLTNAEFNALAKKIDSELGIGNMERAQELLITPREEKSTGTEISPQDIARGLDELTTAKGGSKNIGGVKVTYVPRNGYRVTHKAPSGTELTTGYDSIEEAQQAVMFRLNRIKKGEIPAISEAAESKPAEGIPIQGTNWLSLPSGTRVTNEGAREKMARNNERIETIKKIMEGRSAANNFRLGAELKSLQNENEWITSRLPPEKPVTQSSDSSPRELTGDCKIRIRK